MELNGIGIYVQIFMTAYCCFSRYVYLVIQSHTCSWRVPDSRHSRHHNPVVFVIFSP